LSGVGLGTHDTTTPLTLALLVFGAVAFLDGREEFGEFGLVFGADFGNGEDGGSLLVNDRTETSLAFDYGVGNSHLSAKSWEENNKLNWVNVVGDENQRSFLVLNQTNDMVQSIFNSIRLLANILLGLALLDGSSLLQQSLLLLGLGFWAVLVEKLEGLSGGVTVEHVLELGNGRWDLEAHVEDLSLALKTDIFWPSDHTRQVSSRLDILTNAKVAGALLYERVLGGFL